MASEDIPIEDQTWSPVQMPIDNQVWGIVMPDPEDRYLFNSSNIEMSIEDSIDLQEAVAELDFLLRDITRFDNGYVVNKLTRVRNLIGQVHGNIPDNIPNDGGIPRSTPNIPEAMAGVSSPRACQCDAGITRTGRAEVHAVSAQPRDSETYRPANIKRLPRAIDLY